VTCAIYRREETVPQHRKERAAEHLREIGWKQTVRLTKEDKRLWICLIHHEPGSYAVYRDKETDRTRLGANDLPDLKDGS